MATLSRRRGSASTAPDEDEAPRRRSRRDENEDSTDEAPRRSRRSRDEDDQDEAPTRRRTSSRSRNDDDEDEAPRRRGSREGGSSRRGSTGGFSSYSQKRRSNSSFAEEFKPEPNKPVLIKFLDAEPFDVYLQHWLDEMPTGTRKSYVCHDDEYFEDFEDGCPLDDIGDKPSTFALWNVLDLTNPRKPEVKVWKTSVTVTDKLERLATSDKTKPLDREDIYFEVTMAKQKRKTEWDIQPVKARDLEEDFDIEPFDADELDDFKEKRFEDRKAVTQVDDYEALLEIAEGL